MRDLISDDLTFRTFDKNECLSDNENNEKSLYEYCISQLNSWTNENLNQTLELENQPLGDSLSNTYSSFNKTDLYFIFKEQELVATTLLTPQTILIDKQALSTYANHCQVSNVSKLKGFMDSEKAIKLLSNPIHNSCYISCLAVNPDHQRKGIGSKILSTLSEHIDFFDPSPTHLTLTARVHKSNPSSQKTFLNNGFETFLKMDLSDYNTFYKEL